MKQYLCLLALLCLFARVPAQEKAVNSGLSIGDQVPEVILENILNYPTGQARLSDYQGKWLILDFWATWCSPCIAMFPKTDALEKEFEGKVQFLAVTYQKESEVTRLFSKMDALEGLTPPIVVGDSVLRALFPHRSLPHYVWINPEGKVAAITDLYAITVKNITTMIKKGSANLRVKHDGPFAPFDYKDSLFTLNPLVNKNSVLYTSTLTGYVEGVDCFAYCPDRRILAMNFPLTSLYQIAYGGGKNLFVSNTTIIEVRERNKFVTDLTGAAARGWLKDNGYCFEVNVPAGAPENKYLIMQQALEQYFPQYKATAETREIKVLALVRTSDQDKIRSLGGKPVTDIKPYGAILRNRPLSYLVRLLKVKYHQLLPTPVMDHTGYKGKVDITLDADLNNVASLRKALQVYDLDLVEHIQEIEVLVIRDVEKDQAP